MLLKAGFALGSTELGHLGWDERETSMLSVRSIALTLFCYLKSDLVVAPTQGGRTSYQ